MNKKTHGYVIALVLLLFGTGLWAQENEKEALAKLSFMMGNWKGTSTVYSKDTTKSVEVTEKVQYILEGNLMVLDVKSPLIQLHTVISYNMEEGVYYYSPFSNRGGASYKGRYEEGKFKVTFSEKRRLTFERTPEGAFHEYGEKLTNGVWEKYFEDVLYPFPEGE
ncbi:hypothetical protein [Spongiimicrobium salis]|uniref:hypothetical protein n=1 Tax=Spongiimicrobium salis TaxID=1667022 RepID=UPI00374CEC03